MRVFFFFLFVFLINASDLFAQSEQSTNTIEETLSSNEELVQNEESTPLYDALQDIAQHPINLNQATREDLEQLYFLSALQVENLLFYLYRFHSMKSIFELQLVEVFKQEDIQRLLPYVYIGPTLEKKDSISWRDFLKYGKNEMLVRYDRCLETKKGYADDSYIGDANYLSFKYRYNYKNNLLVGFTAEKDAGEKYWSKQMGGTDFSGFYLQLNDFRAFKSVVLGNYYAGFGQGLLLNNYFGMGKGSSVLSVESRAEGIRKASSANEYNFFRGIATSIKIKKVLLTTAYSNRKLDAAVEENSFTGFKTDGLHRTEAECSKSDAVQMQLCALNAKYRGEQFSIGLTGVYLWMDKDLQPSDQLYNRWAFHGKQQAGLSLDYKYRWRNVYLFGESAVNQANAMATVNGLHIHANSQLDFVLLYRNYSAAYDMLTASSFAASSKTSNEKGLYMGAIFSPLDKWKFSVYADSFQYPWLKYGISKPSVGYDFLLQADYNYSNNLSMYVRFRYKQTEDDVANEGESTLPIVDKYNRSSFRYRLNYSLSEQLKLSNTLELNYSKKTIDSPTYGYLFTQDLFYQFEKFPIKLNLRYAFFDALNYENRLYAYEHDVLYAFSIPMLYGKGCRYYFNLKYSVNKQLSFWLKYSQTSYLNKSVIGTDLEEIAGNKKRDVRLLVRWVF